MKKRVHLAVKSVPIPFNHSIKLTVRLFSERVHKNSPRAGQKRTLGKHLAPHGDENCRNGLHITKPCTPK
jgi:hypothetical protein